MKKIAICISGHMRTFEHTFEKFKKNILEPLQTVGEVDIFIATWSELSTNQSWSARTNPKHIAALSNNIINHNKIKELYNPKSCLINCGWEVIRPHLTNKNLIGQEIKIPDNLGENDMFWFVPMHYQIFNANSLKENWERNNNIKYDITIRYRPDTYIDEKFNLTILNNLDKIYVENVNKADEAYGDVFWVGSSEIIDKVSSLFLNLKDVIDVNLIRGPEQILYKWINKNDIKVEKFPIEVKFMRDADVGLI